MEYGAQISVPARSLFRSLGRPAELSSVKKGHGGLVFGASYAKNFWRWEVIDLQRASKTKQLSWLGCLNKLNSEIWAEFELHSRSELRRSQRGSLLWAPWWGAGSYQNASRIHIYDSLLKTLETWSVSYTNTESTWSLLPCSVFTSVRLDKNKINHCYSYLS